MSSLKLEILHIDGCETGTIRMVEFGHDDQVVNIHEMQPRDIMNLMLGMAFDKGFLAEPMRVRDAKQPFRV